MIDLFRVLVIVTVLAMFSLAFLVHALVQRRRKWHKRRVVIGVVSCARCGEPPTVRRNDGQSPYSTAKITCPACGDEAEGSDYDKVCEVWRRWNDSLVLKKKQGG